MKNSRADGLLELDDGKTVLLEIKYALGWAKCCEARIQFQWFLTSKAYDRLCIKKPGNALIIFHHFSYDWAKEAQKRRHLNGWSEFYTEENTLNKDLIKTHIVQFMGDGLLNPLFCSLLETK